jgi:photosystem II stability/assembly factor-like uncharacterized protein
MKIFESTRNTLIVVVVAALHVPVCQAVPNLATGVWTDLTPSWLKNSANFQVNLIAIDPANADVLYLTGSHGAQLGLIKSTDRGATWVRIGTPPSNLCTYQDTITYLESPFKVAVDPADARHLYATEMSPGGNCNTGFWVTTDGGLNWIRPKGFMDAVKAANGTTDVGHFDVDPTDFKHVIISCHYYWTGTPNSASGFYETKDGGNTFVAHNPAAGMTTASKSICFMYEPTLKLGSKDTWLVVEDMSTVWQTTDAGNSWTEVYAGNMVHGGCLGHCWTKAGAFYTGGLAGPLRTTDTGKTWSIAPNAPYQYYDGTATDGNKLYICGAGAGAVWNTSPENDGTHWTPYAGGALPSNGASEIRFDPVNRIMYSANGTAGIWAVKVDSGTGVQNAKASAVSRAAMAKPCIRIVGSGVAAKTPSGTLFDIKGQMLARLR